MATAMPSDASLLAALVGPPETVAPPGSADGALHSVATTAAERQGHSDQPLTAEIEARYETEEKVALWLLDTYNTAIKKCAKAQRKKLKGAEARLQRDLATAGAQSPAIQAWPGDFLQIMRL